ncbi:hypothetical protein CDEF62S_04356 [Castellaniella defragrans]
MHSAAAIISRSPRQAPAGADDNPDSRANATPSMATSTPVVLRRVRGSPPVAAPTIRVSNGSVDSARAPRAAVVKISEALKRMGNIAKNNTPRPAIAGQSLRDGSRAPCRSASGSRNAKPMPNRSAPVANGSMVATR